MQHTYVQNKQKSAWLDRCVCACMYAPQHTIQYLSFFSALLLFIVASTLCVHKAGIPDAIYAFTVRTCWAGVDK